MLHSTGIVLLPDEIVNQTRVLNGSLKSSGGVLVKKRQRRKMDILGMHICRKHGLNLLLVCTRYKL
jgi:hypothetical protein